MQKEKINVITTVKKTKIQLEGGRAIDIDKEQSLKELE